MEQFNVNDKVLELVSHCLLGNPQVGLSTDRITDSDGEILIGYGVKSKWLGAFTKVECQLIGSVIFQYNEYILRNLTVLKIIHTKDSLGKITEAELRIEGKDRDILYKKLISERDLHLFCGSSDYLSIRVDINKKSKATIFKSVQDVIKLLQDKGAIFDIIMIDPPYNSVYDKNYGTHCLNNIDNGTAFIDWLVDSCVSILSPFGLLISKNWRSIRPTASRFITGMVSMYGGYRRNTLLEVWQYIPESNKGVELFDFSINDHNEYWKLNDKKWKEMDYIKWIASENSDWSDLEKEYIELTIEKREINKVIVITDNKDIGLILPDAEVLVKTPVEFLGYVPKRLRDSDYQYPKIDELYDLVIVADCDNLGGNTELTKFLKIHIPNTLKTKGLAIWKSYFNPALDKPINIYQRNKETKKRVLLETIQPLLELIDRKILTYNNREKTDMLTTFQRAEV